MKQFFAWCRRVLLCRFLSEHDFGPYVHGPRELANSVCHNIDGTKTERLVWARQRWAACQRCGKTIKPITIFEKVDQGRDVRLTEERQRWN